MVHGWCQCIFRWSVQEASHESRARSPESHRQRASASHRTRNLQGAGSSRPAASHGLAACGASPGCEMGPAEVPGSSQDPPVFPGLLSLGLRSHTSVLQALQPPPASLPPTPRLFTWPAHHHLKALRKCHLLGDAFPDHPGGRSPCQDTSLFNVLLTLKTLKSSYLSCIVSFCTTKYPWQGRTFFFFFFWSCLPVSPGLKIMPGL